MSLKITPEIEASMRATKAEMDAAMRDPSFRAEVEEMKLRYKARELIEALFAKPTNARMFAALPKRRRYALNITVGAGEPVEVRELVH